MAYKHTHTDSHTYTCTKLRPKTILLYKPIISYFLSNLQRYTAQVIHPKHEGVLSPWPFGAVFIWRESVWQL